MPFDRSTADLGNVVEFGHVNVFIPDQRLATAFYVSGLGLTRDPFVMTGIDNMWVNAGRSQFHLPSGRAQVVAGVIGLVLPDREALLRRLASVRDSLAETRFAVAEHEDFVQATCPWGNRIQIHAPDPDRFGRVALGIAHVAFDVAPGTTPGIARFYRDILGTPATTPQAGLARVPVSIDQVLLFRETDRPIAAHDGNHVQITLADFSGPHRRLQDRGLVTEESNAHQYRFETITDPDSGAALFTVEHEVRSMRHPMFARPLVNRNPAQTARGYVPGHDSYLWTL